MSPLKICFVIQKLAGLSGGAERILSDVCNAMSKRGMDVTILTFEASAADPHYPFTNIKHYNLFPASLQKAVQESAPSTAKKSRLEAVAKSIPNVPPLTHIKWSLTYGKFISSVRKSILENRPDVIVGFMPTGIMVSTLAAKDLGVPVIASTHNLPQHDYDDIERWDTNPIYRKRRVDVFDNVARILVLQPEFSDWFKPSLRPKIEVMPNPVTQAEHGSTVHRTKTILGVGRLTKIKRFDRLIDAWSKIADDNPDWQLKIFGVGPEMGALQSLIDSHGISNQTRLAGSTEHIFDEYANASVLCHPSQFEGFGLSVAEALSHGLPVVASEQCAGVSRLVENGKNGYLIDETLDFVGGLSDALQKLINSPQDRLSFGKHGKESMQNFAPDRIFDKWEALLKATVAGELEQD